MSGYPNNMNQPIQGQPVPVQYSVAPEQQPLMQQQQQPVVYQQHYQPPQQQTLPPQQANHMVQVQVPQPQVMAPPAVPAGATMQRGDVTRHQAPPNFGANTNTGQDPNNPAAGLVPSPTDRFPGRGKWVDVPWIFVFALHTIGFIAVFAWQAVETEAVSSIGFSFPGIFALDIVLFFLCAILIGAVFGFTILLLSKSFARQIMWTCVVLQGLLLLAQVIWLIVIPLVNGSDYVPWPSIIWGVIWLIIFIIYVVCIRHSINLAAALISGAAVAVEKNWGMKVTALCNIFNHVLMGALWFMMICLYIHYLGGNNFNNPDMGWFCALVFWGMFFAMPYISFTLANTMHTTYAGSVARFFYMGQERQGESPTVASLKLATTRYFGAACFGGFIMAVITWLKNMARYAEAQSRSSGNLAGMLCACICLCFIACLETVFKVVNSYALIYTAIYGNNFWTSGKMVWQLAKKTGLEPLWQDSAIRYFRGGCLIVVFFLSFGLLGALSIPLFGDSNLFDFWGNLADMEWEQILAYFLIYLFGMIMSCVTCSSILQPLDSGARTLMVIFMEAPAYFYQHHPKIYGPIRDRAAKLKIVDKAPAYFVYQ